MLFSGPKHLGPDALPDPRGDRRLRRPHGQRHHERGPHQLLRGRPLGRAAHRALGRERPHGVPARHARRQEARRAARRRLQRAAPVVREPPLRHGGSAHLRPLLPQAAPVLRLRHRDHRRDPERVDGRPARLLPPVLRPEQRVDLHRRQLRSGARSRPSSLSTSVPSRVSPTWSARTFPSRQLPGVVEETFKDQVAKIPQLRARVGRREDASTPTRLRETCSPASSPQGKASRLYQELVHRRQIASTSTRRTTAEGLGGVFGVEATVKEGHTTPELAAGHRADPRRRAPERRHRRRGRAGRAR